MISINSLSFMSLSIFLSRAFFNGLGYSNMLSLSANDSFISVILGTLLGVVYLKLFLNNNKYNFIKFLFIIFNTIILFNDFVNFSSIKYLLETSNIIIFIIYLVPILYILKKGINPIFISSLFMLYISIVIFTTNSVTLFNEIDVNNLKPLFNNSIIDILSSSIVYFIYSVNPLIILNIFNKDNKYKKNIITGYIISSLSIFVIIFYITTIYDYSYTNLFNYPVYFVLKKIKYNFISNAENILSFIFIIDYFYSLLIYFYLIYYYIKDYKYKYFIFISIILFILYVSIIKFDNLITLINIKNLYPIISLVFIIISSKKNHKTI